MGIPNSWMVYKLRENPIYKWMMTGGTPILGNPHMYRQKTGLQKRNLLYFSQLQVQRIDHDTLLKASRSVRVLQRVLFYFTMESLIRPTRTQGSVCENCRVLQDEVRSGAWAASALCHKLSNTPSGGISLYIPMILPFFMVKSQFCCLNPNCAWLSWWNVSILLLWSKCCSQISNFCSEIRILLSSTCPKNIKNRLNLTCPTCFLVESGWTNHILQLKLPLTLPRSKAKRWISSLSPGE